MKEESALYYFTEEKKIVVDPQKGITLRDYFAAKAMQTILASQYEDGIYVGDLDNDSEDVCAISAYAIADAMLKAREK